MRYRASRRIPVLPTLVVLAAVGLMIWLGLWQLLVRWPQKEATLAQLAANPARAEIAYPQTPDPSLLFRRAHGRCLAPASVTLVGAGSLGFRAIAHCHRTAEGPGMIVQLGTTRDPLAKVAWAGGAVSGRLGQAPEARPWVAALFSRHEPDAMLVADPPLAGLAPSQRPDLADIPNNHLSYAVQWFLFALTAVVIYALALRRRAIGFDTRPKDVAPKVVVPTVVAAVVPGPGPR